MINSLLCVSRQLAHSPLLHAMGSPVASATLGTLALLGPGRKILVDGVLALVRCGNFQCLRLLRSRPCCRPWFGYHPILKLKQVQQLWLALKHEVRCNIYQCERLSAS